MKEELAKRGIHEVDGIMMDLGVSSPQFDDPTRGFSYRYDARLDMRMNQEQELDAYQIVNTYSFEELCRILREYGEEKFAKSIARAIEKQRAIQPIETTFQLWMSSSQLYQTRYYVKKDIQQNKHSKHCVLK